MSALLSIPLIFSPVASYATNDYSNHRGDYYIGLGGNYTQLKIDDIEFNPTVLRFRAGVFVLENIALEVQLGTGVSSESPLESLDIEIDGLQAIYARFQSPTQRGFRIYLQAGYANTQLLQTEESNGESVKRSFPGFSYGLGIEDQFKYFKPVYVYLEANKLFNDGFDINSVNAGIRYTF